MGFRSFLGRVESIKEKIWLHENTESYRSKQCLHMIGNIERANKRKALYLLTQWQVSGTPFPPQFSPP